MTKKKVGHISIPDDVDVWDHEFRTAMALKRAGHDVDFIKKSNNAYERTPDCLVDGEIWELKAPKADNVRALDRNVRKALKQAPRLVIDIRRMKNVTDDTARRALEKYASEMRSMKALRMVTRQGEVIDIQ